MSVIVAVFEPYYLMIKRSKFLVRVLIFHLIKMQDLSGSTPVDLKKFIPSTPEIDGELLEQPTDQPLFVFSYVFQSWLPLSKGSKLIASSSKMAKQAMN